MLARVSQYVIAVLALLTAALPVARAQEDALPPAAMWPPGQYVMQTRRVTEREAYLADRPQPPHRLVQQMALGLTVTAGEEAGSRRIEIRVLRIRERMEIGTQTAAYDSGGRPQDQHPSLARILSPLLSLRLTVELTAEGEARISGLDEYWAELAERKLADERMLSHLQAQLSAESWAAWFTDAAKFLPPDGVEPDETWDVEIPGRVLGQDAPAEIECTLAADDDAEDALTVTFEGTRSAEGDEEPPAGGAALRTLAASLSGTLRLDPESGMAREVTVQEEGGMEYVAATPGGEVPMQTEQVTETVVRVAPAAEKTDTEESD